MTQVQFNAFLSIGAGICALLALLNLARSGKRGLSAYLMAAACLCVGIAMALWRSDPGGALPIALSVAAFLLLAADMVVRARPREGP